MPPFYTIGLNEINVSKFYKYKTLKIQNPWANGNNDNADANARRMMLAPLMEAIISHKLFEDEISASRTSSGQQEDFKNREQVVVLNPTKYSVKPDDVA